MKNSISKSDRTIKKWWLFLTSGILLIGLAVLVIFTPIESYLSLSALFSVVMLFNGISNAVFSISNRNQLKGWGWYLIAGLIEFTTGNILMFYPGLSMLSLPVIVSLWLIIRGVQIIGTSLDLKKIGVIDWGWLLILGVSIIIISMFMLLFPTLGMLNVVIFSSFALFLNGITFIITAFKLKKLKSKTDVIAEEQLEKLKYEIIGLKNIIINGLQGQILEKQIHRVENSFATYESKIKGV